MSAQTKAIAARFRLSPAGPHNPDVRACTERYLGALGLPLDSESTAHRWALVTDGNRVVAVVGERVHPGTRIVEIAELFTAPGRNGVLAAYATMLVLKRLVDANVIDCVIASTDVTNVPQNKALERVFGAQPAGYIWSYGSSSPRGTPQTSAGSLLGVERPKSVDAEEIFGLGKTTVDRVFRKIFGEIDEGSEM